MKDIQYVVERIVDKCNMEKVEVGATLAAFVARVVVLENPHDFQLDATLTEKNVDALVSCVVDKLRLCDSPQMETLRMQVDFDTVFMEMENSLRSTETSKKLRLNTFKASIVNVDHIAITEYEMINAMYRQVFSFLIMCVGADVSKDLAVEREVAAAMESVFPKINLKAFKLMEPEDQKLQLGELASIVMGIRLFNRRIGKGGAGIKDIPEMARNSAQSLLQTLREEKEITQTTCQEYSSTLVYAHRLRPGEGPEQAKVERWQHELNNRRQYLSFVSSLEDDAIHALQTLQKLSNQLEQVLVRLQDLVGANASVSKDQVYPKFDLVAEIWNNLRQEYELIRSRHAVWDSLEQFRESYTFTLDSHWLDRALQDERWDRQSGEEKIPSKRSILETAPTLETLNKNNNIGEEAAPTAAAAATAAESKTADVNESKTSDITAAPVPVPDPGAAAFGSVPELLTPESTPEFMNLPLDYQGYCPVTAARRGGLLLPGDPSFGVVRHGSTYAVFYSEECAQEFMRDPKGVVSALLSTARAYPELINLLELQRHFPDTSLVNIFKSARNASSNTLGQPRDQQPVMVDAGTETPTHFKERHIDPNYEWNEWALRRKAIQLVNLCNVKTNSTQTIKSHFRRESESQVFLPKHSGTQTGISKAINPPKQMQYVTGLRGLSNSRYAKKQTGGEQQDEARSTVVQMTYEY